MGRPEPVDLLDTIVGERRLLGTAGHVWDSDVVTAMQYLADGVVLVAPLLSAQVPLEDVVDAGFGRLTNRARETFKVLVRP